MFQLLWGYFFKPWTMGPWKAVWREASQCGVASPLHSGNGMQHCRRLFSRPVSPWHSCCCQDPYRTTPIVGWGWPGRPVPIPIHCCFLLKHGMLGRNLRIELQGEATLNCDVGQGQRPAATSTTRWAPGQWALAPPHHTQAARPEYVERKKISARSFVFKD